MAAAALGCATMQGAQGPEAGPVVATAEPAANPGEASGAPAAASQDVSAAPAASPAPRTAAECVALAATPAAATSASDPQKQLDEVFLANHETFRCCIDALVAPKAGRVDANMALVVTLDSAGKLTSSDILLSETSVQAPDAQACVLDVAKALAYPKPGNDMDIRYKRVFQFKARR
jgi:hypothetical protein